MSKDDQLLNIAKDKQFLIDGCGQLKRGAILFSRVNEVFSTVALSTITENSNATNKKETKLSATEKFNKRFNRGPAKPDKEETKPEPKTTTNNNIMTNEYFSNSDDEFIALAYYELALGLEFILKGLCLIFGEEPDATHIINSHCRKLLNLKYKIPALKYDARLTDTLGTLQSSKFGHCTHDWMISGRYGKIDETTDTKNMRDIAVNACRDLLGFARNYQLFDICDR